MTSLGKLAFFLRLFTRKHQGVVSVVWGNVLLVMMYCACACKKNAHFGWSLNTIYGRIKHLSYLVLGTNKRNMKLKLECYIIAVFIRQKDVGAILVILVFGILLKSFIMGLILINWGSDIEGISKEYRGNIKGISREYQIKVRNKFRNKCENFSIEEISE